MLLRFLCLFLGLVVGPVIAKTLRSPSYNQDSLGPRKKIHNYEHYFENTEMHRHHFDRPRSKQHPHHFQQKHKYHHPKSYSSFRLNHFIKQAERAGFVPDESAWQPFLAEEDNKKKEEGEKPTESNTTTSGEPRNTTESTTATATAESTTTTITTPLAETTAAPSSSLNETTQMLNELAAENIKRTINAILNHLEADNGPSRSGGGVGVENGVDDDNKLTDENSLPLSLGNEEQPVFEQVNPDNPFDWRPKLKYDMYANSLKNNLQILNDMDKDYSKEMTIFTRFKRKKFASPFDFLRNKNKKKKRKKKKKIHNRLDTKDKRIGGREKRYSPYRSLLLLRNIKM